MTEQIMNITTNFRAIETIKSEILQEVAKLYGIISDFEDTDLYENTANSVATIIAMDYIFARRMGISFGEIDKRIINLTGIAEENNHELELAFGDMSDLRNFIKRRSEF